MVGWFPYKGMNAPMKYASLLSAQISPQYHLPELPQYDLPDLRGRHGLEEKGQRSEIIRAGWMDGWMGGWK